MLSEVLAITDKAQSFVKLQELWVRKRASDEHGQGVRFRKSSTSKHTNLSKKYTGCENSALLEHVFQRAAICQAISRKIYRGLSKFPEKCKNVLDISREIPRFPWNINIFPGKSSAHGYYTFRWPFSPGKSKLGQVFASWKHTKMWRNIIWIWFPNINSYKFMSAPPGLENTTKSNQAKSWFDLRTALIPRPFQIKSNRLLRAYKMPPNRMIPNRDLI